MAWGFEPLFYNVLERHAVALRRRLFNYCGTETAYYRYNRGDKHLTPAQQQDILDIFAEYGYDPATLSFAHYTDEYNFNEEYPPILRAATAPQTRLSSLESPTSKA